MPGTVSKSPWAGSSQVLISVLGCGLYGDARLAQVVFRRVSERVEGL